ncbi:hypothetical protein GKZ68_03005 [Hymenobacter sp. BRD128]|uniref:7TM-DISM domain-containing protein n=1 Tax=Hymenobacter sp. BRD128 TaxID=2675878 RepID=UPI00156550A5|nr:7TM-DISM domain-containing protein [Hymenobacter sp. BRD128]QKG55698.1 hypothetical protein GKZ68_03005 [Hymenobacter sp. BRD128]
MPRGWAFLLVLASGLRAVAQPAAGVEVVRVGAVPDQHYSWDRIRTDTTLAFAPADSLHPAQSRRYWLRLALRNPSHYTQATELTVLPNLDNTLFYIDEDARAWRRRRAGVAVPTDSQRVRGSLPLWLPGHRTSTVYVLVDLRQRASLPAAVHLRVLLKPLAEVKQADAFFSTAWAVSLAVLGLLLLTNVPTYLRYRDRPTLFYICTQLGGCYTSRPTATIFGCYGRRPSSASCCCPPATPLAIPSTTC